MKVLLATMLLVLATATASGAKMPDPSVSEYVKTESGGFILERDAGVKYAMTYTLRKPSESATSYKVVFESAIPKEDPIVSEGSITQGNFELLVQSPIMNGVKNNHTFTVSLILFADGEELATHNDEVRFSMPSDLMAQFGIKEF